MKKPKIIIWDIETFPAKVTTWGSRMYDEQIIEVEKPWELASFAYKYLDEPKVYCHTRQGRRSDKQLIKKLHAVLNSADILIGQNIRRFDIKKANTRMIKAGLAPYKPSANIDTLEIFKSKFAFTSNKLNDVAEFLGVGAKVETGGYGLWKACMANDAKAWAKMVKYNKHDVVLTEQVYKRVAPWATKVPNLALITDRPAACPKCGVEGKMQSRGFVYTSTGKRRSYQCQACTGWSTFRTAEKTAKPDYV